jgi:nucleoid-associated protein YgaU
VVFLSAVALGVTVLAGRAGAGAERSPRVFIVHRGDTVWSIAVRAAGPAADPRPVVDRLIEANDIHDARISPGTRLILP